MARKPKATSGEKPAGEGPASSENGRISAAEPKKKPRASGTAAKKKKPAEAKTSAAKQPVTSKPKPAISQPRQPTDDEIRLRAYFLAERRQRLSLPGDSNHDWIEARRQLIEEAGR